MRSEIWCFLPCMVMLTHLPSFWYHMAGCIIVMLYAPPSKIVLRIIFPTQYTWRSLFVRYEDHLKDLQCVAVTTVKKIKTCVVTPWRLVLLKGIASFTMRIIAAQDKAKHTTCRHLIWHTMGHCNKTLRDIWHDLLYRTCTDRQTTCIKETQTVYIEYLCGCTYLKICADERQRPKDMTTHRIVIDGQPRRIIE